MRARPLPFRLVLRWEVCQDGVSWEPTSEWTNFDKPVPAPDGQQVYGLLGGHFAKETRDIPMFSDNSERVEFRPQELRDLDRAVVLQFVNAATVAQLSEFLGGVGFPTQGYMGYRPISETEESLRARQDYLRSFLLMAGADNRFLITDTINELLGSFGSGEPRVSPPPFNPLAPGLTGPPEPFDPYKRALKLMPALEYPAGAQFPQFVFRAETLAQFMAMEVALIGVSGAGASKCEVCDRVYLYGPSTSRAKKGRYCSSACRQRGFQRERKAAGKAASKAKS